MARELLYRRYWTRVSERQRRLPPGVVSSWDRSYKREWTDYHPDLPATVPEKMIYQALESRGISFYFGEYWGDMPFTPDKYEAYRPDFIIPSAKVIIEVTGTYWHSRKDSFLKDAKKALMYIAAGWHPYFLLDTDITNNPYEALDQIPELRGMGKETNFFIDVNKRSRDPAAALIAARTKWPHYTYYKTAVSRSQTQRSWHVGQRRPYQISGTDYHAVFVTGDIPPSLAKEYRQLGRNWNRQVQQLVKYIKWSEAARRYYYKWKDWWRRYVS